jgi:hypothetical protein
MRLLTKEIEMAQHTPGPWIKYNPLTATYDTPDGTEIPEELANNVLCLTDVLYIAQMREKQRAAIAKATGEK